MSFSRVAHRFALLCAAAAGAVAIAACSAAPSSPDESASEQSSVSAAAGAKLSFTPGSKSFGAVAVNTTSAATTFTLKNGGTAATAAIAISLSGKAPSAFRLSADTCAGKALKAGGSCTVEVTFAPTTAGTETATLAASAKGITAVDASLSGTGVATAALAITPGAFSFGSVSAGDSSADATFTVTNVGGGTTGTLAPFVTGPSPSSFLVDADTCAGAQLAPEASCTVRVRFAPAAGASGAASALLEVGASPGGSAWASLTGTAASAARLALIAPAGWSGFGTVSIGQSSSATFTVANEGGSATAAVNIASSNPDFAVNGSTCSAPLLPNAECTFVATFRPSTASPESATLTASSAVGGSTTLAVTGVGEL